MPISTLNSPEGHSPGSTGACAATATMPPKLELITPNLLISTLFVSFLS
ncbi:MAG: hypothetical protein ACXQTR_01615 [Candidatus Methanospirareceae archaeon]